MGFFKKKKETKPSDQPSNPEADIHAITEINMILAHGFLRDEDYENAFDRFKIVAENTDNSEAQYNLGCMYAQGLGTEQSFVEAGYWFHTAYKNGDESAGRMILKCMLDSVNSILPSATAEDIYTTLSVFVNRVFHGENIEAILHEKLSDMGTHYFRNKRDFAAAAKLFRAGAEYANDGFCQNNLAVLYNAGAGVEKNDLAALYWFDRASDQGVEAARNDRDGIFCAYLNKLGKQETANQLRMLVDWCKTGANPAVPIDETKANHWNQIIATL